MFTAWSPMRSRSLLMRETAGQSQIDGHQLVERE
jgi:hypothetical protein